MELEVFDIIVFVTGIIAGFVAAFVFRALGKKGALAKHQSTGATIEALQNELERRQVLADDHFLQINGHLQAAEKKLADVRKTLNEGASALSTVEFTKPEVESDNTATDTFNAPPRDYATKDKFDQGMLSEGFGLKREHIEEPKRTI